MPPENRAPHTREEQRRLLASHQVSSSGLSYGADAPTPTPGQMIDEILRLIQAENRRLEYAELRGARRILFAIAVAIAGGSFSYFSFEPQGILAAEEFAPFGVAATEYGYTIGLVLFSLRNAMAVYPWLLSLVRYACYNPDTQRFSLKAGFRYLGSGIVEWVEKMRSMTHKQRFAEMMRLFIYNPIILLLLIGSMVASLAGVSDAFDTPKNAEFLREHGNWVPELLSTIGTFFSAFQSNGRFVLTKALAASLGGFFLRGRLICLPCCHSSAFNRGISLTYANRRQVFAQFIRTIEALMEQNLGEAGHIASVYFQRLKHEQIKKRVLRRADTFGGSSLSNRDQLYHDFMKYVGMTQVSGQAMVLPGPKSTRACLTFKTLAAVVSGIVGPIPNFIAGIFKGGSSLMGMIWYGAGGYIVNFFINAFVALQAPDLIYDLTIRPFYHTYLRYRNPDSMRSIKRVWGEWFGSVILAGIAAIPAYFVFGGIKGVMTVLSLSVAFLKKLPFLVSIFSTSSGIGQGINATTGFLGLFRSLIGLFESCAYKRRLEEQFSTGVEDYINSNACRNRTAAATVAVNLFLKDVASLEAGLNRLTPTQFNMLVILFDELMKLDLDLDLDQVQASAVPSSSRDSLVAQSNDIVVKVNEGQSDCANEPQFDLAQLANLSHPQRADMPMFFNRRSTGDGVGSGMAALGRNSSCALL